MFTNWVPGERRNFSGGVGQAMGRAEQNRVSRSLQAQGVPTSFAGQTARNVVAGSTRGVLGGGSTNEGPGSIGVGTTGFGTTALPGSPAAAAAPQTPESLAASALAERFPRILSDIDALRAAVQPGSSQILEAGLGAIEAGRSRTVGTLRESLARRGVLGSSFGRDDLARANAEFAQQEAGFRGNVVGQELAATQDILQFETALLNQELTRELQELQISNEFQLGLQSIASQNRQLEEQLAFQESQGKGSLFGTLGGFALDRLIPARINIGSGGGGLFGGLF